MNDLSYNPSLNDQTLGYQDGSSSQNFFPATLVLEFWKRRKFRLHYEWDLVEYDEDDNLIRPEYEKAADQRKINKYTLQEEPGVSKKKRYRNTIISYTAMLFWVSACDRNTVSTSTYPSSGFSGQILLSLWVWSDHSKLFAD